MLVDEKKLKKLIQLERNVLFEGERGVGKTAVISKLFSECGLKVKYFSGATMDAWIHLIGAPTKVRRLKPEHRAMSATADPVLQPELFEDVMRIAMPEDILDGGYDVFFIDELNRAPPEVINALMEVIQSGSINGRRLGVKMCWAAINPFKEDAEELEYQVTRLDPAVEDRFHVRIKFPYQVDRDLIIQKFGLVGGIMADWWTAQPLDVQLKISPRRLFYAAEDYKHGISPSDFFTEGDVKTLEKDLAHTTWIEEVQSSFHQGQFSVNAQRALRGAGSSPLMLKFLMHPNNLDLCLAALPWIDEAAWAREYTASSGAAPSASSPPNLMSLLVFLKKHKSMQAQTKAHEIAARLSGVSGGGPLNMAPHGALAYPPQLPAHVTNSEQAKAPGTSRNIEAARERALNESRRLLQGAETKLQSPASPRGLQTNLNKGPKSWDDDL